MKAWINLLKKVVGEDKYPTLKRVMAGKVIVAWALLPANFSFWMLPIGTFMAAGIRPSVWAKTKLIDFKEWRRLR